VHTLDSAGGGICSMDFYSLNSCLSLASGGVYTTTICLCCNDLHPSVAMGKWPATAVPSLLLCPSSNGCASPIATVEHVAHAQLLLAPTLVMGTLTSWTVATMGHVAHAWLLLALIAVTDTLTLVDRCYYWICGTRTIAASTHNSDGHSNISGSLLLLDMWHTHGCCWCPQ
jgi:hypothetical protein